jgi:hypothetical protein
MHLQVKHLELEHSGQLGRRFCVKLQAFTAPAFILIETDISAGTSKPKRQDAMDKHFQFPTVSNSATTVHKLQGVALERLFVSSWSHQKSWVCVVLSTLQQPKVSALKTN